MDASAHLTPEIVVRPVTPGTWEHFERLFAARGAPHYCWCSIYRFPDAQRMDQPAKKAGIHGLVTDGIPIGLLAYEGEDPVGWCSVAPRESYLKLDRSRSMPRATPLETPTWSVLCFFISRASRGRGVARALLNAAVEHARTQGAEVIEGYPFDTAGISATHRGHSSWFQEVGFQQDGRRWFLALQPA